MPGQLAVLRRIQHRVLGRSPRGARERPRPPRWPAAGSARRCAGRALRPDHVRAAAAATQRSSSSPAISGLRSRAVGASVSRSSSSFTPHSCRPSRRSSVAVSCSLLALEHRAPVLVRVDRAEPQGHDRAVGQRRSSTASCARATRSSQLELVEVLAERLLAELGERHPAREHREPAVAIHSTGAAGSTPAGASESAWSARVTQ